jgi:lysophospholipase L1-like esterase
MAFNSRNSIGGYAQSPRMMPRMIPDMASQGVKTAGAPPTARPGSSAVFSLKADANSTRTTRIGVYGDSLTGGFPSYDRPYAKYLKKALTDAGNCVEIIGCGLSGLTAVKLARGLDSPTLEDKFGRVGPGLRRFLTEQGPFDLVIIMAGTNDLEVAHYPPDKVFEKVKLLHQACWAAKIPTVALSIPESSVLTPMKYPEAAKKWHAINFLIAAWAKGKQGDLSLTSPFFVNAARLISFDHAAQARGLWNPDGLHFTAAGSKEFGSKLASILAGHLQALSQQSSTDRSKPKSNISSQQPLSDRTNRSDWNSGIEFLKKLHPGLVVPASKLASTSGTGEAQVKREQKEEKVSEGATFSAAIRSSSLSAASPRDRSITIGSAQVTSPRRSQSILERPLQSTLYRTRTCRTLGSL